MSFLSGIGRGNPLCAGLRHSREHNPQVPYHDADLTYSRLLEEVREESVDRRTPPAQKSVGHIRFAAPDAAPEVSVSKKILVILSERGYWAEELVGPLSAFDG